MRDLGMKPHVLFLPSWYTTRDNPVLGSFFQDQAEAVAAAGCRVAIAFVELRPMNQVNVRSLVEHNWAVRTDSAEGPLTLRVRGWRIPLAKAATDTLWIRQTVRLLKRYIAEHGRPDLIHAHCVHNAGRAAAVAREELGIPFVVTEHFTGYLRGLIDETRGEQARTTFAGASGVVAVSEVLAAALRPFTRDRKVEVIPNVVDTAFYTLPRSPRSEDRFTFLFVGFLTPKKRVDLLLHAFRDVAARHPEASLGIVGDGFQRAELEAMTRNMHLTERVCFHGLLGRSEVRDALWRSHALVSSSDVETFGVTLIEAMSTGLPVVATRSGGPQEFLTEQTGYLVPKGDADAFAKAMETVLAQRSLWTRRTADIRRYVTDHFSQATIGAALVQLYRAAIER